MSTTTPAAQSVLPASVNVRPDLRVHIRREQRVVLEDPTNGKHYRLGLHEYRFFLSLASQQSPQRAHDLAVTHCDSWTAETSQSMLRWMDSRGITVKGMPPEGNLETSGNSKGKSRVPNLLFARMSLGSPERWLAPVARTFKPLFRREVCWLATAIFVGAVWLLVSSWSEFQTAYERLLTPGRVLHVALIWFVLKAVHEMAHGIVCKHWGGHVRNVGVAFIFGVPLPFVDLSDSCRFSARWQRVSVALAGVLAECLIAALAVIAWSATHSPIVHRIAADVVLTVSLGAVLFNLNPLMKFDGYYVLMEWSGLDNLYSRGSQYVTSLRRRIFFGSQTAPIPSTPLFIKAYGFASLAWRILAVVGVFITAIVTLHGVGVILVFLAVYQGWIAPGISSRRNSASVANSPHRLRLLTRSNLVVACLVAASVVAINSFPVLTQDSAHAVVEYDPPVIVRSAVSGFVEQIHVVDNQHVLKGELLVTLSNDDLLLKHAALTAAVNAVEQQLRAARYHQDATKLRHGEAELRGISKQLDEAKQQIAALELRAPLEGIVTSRSLRNLLGTYVETGTEIAAVGSEGSKRLRLLIQQETASRLQVGDTFRYMTLGGKDDAATLTKILPRTIELADQSILGVHNGGPLPVILDGSRGTRFCTPQTPALALLDTKASQHLHVGQRVSVVFGTRQRLSSWLSSQLLSD